MSLVKIFKFRGLYQNGRKMDTPLGSFRRFTNSFKDKTGRILPFGKGYDAGANEPHSPSLAIGTVWNRPVFSAVFKGGILQLIQGERLGNKVGAFKYFNTPTVEIDIGQAEATGRLMDLNQSMTYCPAGNFSHAVINNKLFLCEYVDRAPFNYGTTTNTQDIAAFNLLKFDGAQISRAGLPTPWRPVVVNAAGTIRTRSCYFSVGLDGEMVFSNYVECNANYVSGTSLTVNLGGWSNYPPTTKLVDPIGAAGCTFPYIRQPLDSLFDDGPTPKYYNKKFLFIDGAPGTIYYSSGVGMVFTNCLSSVGLTVGDWLMGLSTDRSSSEGYYLRVKNVSGTTFTFDPNIKKFNIFTLTWEDWNLENGFPDGMTEAQFVDDVNGIGFSNIYLYVGVSGNAAGTLPYKTAAIAPMFWDTNVSATAFVSSTAVWSQPFFGVITDTMSDFYDHNAVKTTFPPVKGITNYSNLLVGFDANAIYFHDTSLGGSSEMVSGYSNIIPYGSEYGPLVAVCGSENFMLICRERKNYVLTGELTTGNVNITECDQAVAGAANARAVSNAFSNKIVFMNNTGVYSVTSSGQITEISEEIRDLFTGRPMDGNPFNPNVFRNTVQKLEAAFDGGIFKIALDEIRGFIYFFTGKIDNAFSLTLEQSNVLVFDTNDGSWYEFDGNGSWTFEALAGKITNLGAKIYTEDGTIRKSDPFSAGDAKQVLLTTSMTMGEPSLEKQATQVKIYGKVEQQLPDEDGNVVRPEIKIGHLTEWKRFEGTPTSEYGTYVSYPRANDVDFDPEQYTHKQKLNSTKAQAVSILIESVDGDAITIEGMEIEIGGVQDGMKR